MVKRQEIAAGSNANCAKKHPTVLHTNFVAQKPKLVNPLASLPSREGVPLVHNAMVSRDGKIKICRNEGPSKTVMAVVPVKVWLLSLSKSGLKCLKHQ